MEEWMYRCMMVIMNWKEWGRDGLRKNAKISCGQFAIRTALLLSRPTSQKRQLEPFCSIHSCVYRFNLKAVVKMFLSDSWRGVRLSSLGTFATSEPSVPALDDDDEYGAVSGMRIGRGNQNTRRKSTRVTFCSPQIPHDLSWYRTAVESRQVTARVVD
jgi:hypothetical protein